MINERSSGAGFFLTTFFARTKKVVNIKLWIYYKNQLVGILYADLKYIYNIIYVIKNCNGKNLFDSQLKNNYIGDRIILLYNPI